MNRLGNTGIGVGVRSGSFDPSQATGPVIGNTGVPVNGNVGGPGNLGQRASTFVCASCQGKFPLTRTSQRYNTPDGLLCQRCYQSEAGGADKP